MKKKIINLKLNGKLYKIYFYKKLTIQHLLAFFDFKFNLIVVEIDGKIVKKIFYNTTYLSNQNNIEVITIVGGG
jgi:sulfur carrier protein